MLVYDEVIHARGERTRQCSVEAETVFMGWFTDHARKESSTRPRNELVIATHRIYGRARIQGGFRSVQSFGISR